MRIWLTISLGFNAVLAAALGWLAWQPGRIGEPVATPRLMVSGEPPAVERPVVVRTGSAATTTFDWRQVESPDYREYVAKLRAVGCPELTVRDIILADVGALYEERERALRARQPAFEYWRGEDPAGAASRRATFLAELAELRREKREVVAQLLGAEVAATLRDDLAVAEALDGRLGFLADGDQRRVVELESRFRSRAAEILFAASVDDPLYKDQDPFEAIGELRQEHEAELARLLGPGAKEAYDLHASPTAERLRRQLGEFRPTEQEFREILQRQKAVDDEFGLRLELFGESPEKRAALARMEQELQVALGEARYEAFKRAMEGASSEP